MMPLWIFLGLIGLILVFGVLIYNFLVVRRTRVDQSWADIDVELKRRYDLITNLVETVKGYAAHERVVFEKVTEARSKAMTATQPADRAQAENLLTGALKSLFAVAENYPTLRAAENFMHLQSQLQDTENKIEGMRLTYNEAVREYNISINVFPNNLVAGLMNFTPREMFEVKEAEFREAPRVKF